MPHWLASALGALLPQPERGELTRRYGGDPPFASMILGAIQFLVGVRLVYESGMAWFHTGGGAMADEFWRIANSRSVGADETLALTWGGAVLWLYWLLRPTTWVLISVVLVGLLRTAAFLTVREAVAEPAVWGAVRLGGLLRRSLGAAGERARFGDPSAPDELFATADGALVVHTPRLKSEWTEATTIEVEGRFYRIAAVDDVESGAERRHRYLLQEAGEHDVIRRLVRYDVPGRSES